jgi:predicted glycoside hydrolase/deacetylase ChbG (UPF0249 family)
MNTEQRNIVINADDVGMHPAIDEGVLRLMERGIVTSASVMALGQPDRQLLAAMRGQGGALGLHLDFTSGMAQRRYGGRATVGSTILAAWSGTLTIGSGASARSVEAAVREQLLRFVELTGARPDFLDGHEHVHQFPVIREALLRTWGALYPGMPVRVRNTRPLRWRGAKAALIGALGAATLVREARRAGHRCNADFVGVYDLSERADLATLWRKWLATVPRSGALAMCHPGLPDAGMEAFRAREFRFLRSQQFADLLARQRVRPGGWGG